MNHHLENDIKSHLDLPCAKLKSTEKEVGATKQLVDTRMFVGKKGNLGQILKQATGINKRKEVLESDPYVLLRKHRKLWLHVTSECLS